MAGPLKVNIPTFKPIESPYEPPDFGKSLASLMQAYSSMARAQAIQAAATTAADPNANAEAAVARGDAYWKYYPNPNDPNNPIKVLITGKNNDVRGANVANADREYLTNLLAADQTIASKLVGLDQFSAKKAKETLDDIRKNDLKRIKDFTGGMDARKILDVMLAPHKAKVDERLKAIEDDSWWNVLGQKISSEGEIALKNLGSFMSPNDAREDIAHGEEINRIRKEAEDNSAYLREQALRASEDESWWSRSDGLSGLLLNSATTVAEAVPNVGVAIAAPVIGTAVAGPAGTAAGLATAGGFNAASQRGEFLARVAADPNLTYEQKLAAAEEGETLASWIGFATGAVPFSVGKVVGKAVGSLPGKVAALPVSRALNPASPRGVGTALADTAMAALEGGLMSGAEMTLQNALYEHATGLDTPLFQNVGDAFIMGAVGGAPFGVAQTFTRPSIRQTPWNPPNVTSSTTIDPAAGPDLLALPPSDTLQVLPSIDAIPALSLDSVSVADTPPQQMPVGPVSSPGLPVAQGRTRPIPMGSTETTAVSQPIAMDATVPDTPEQRLYNALATINKSDKDAESKLKQAVLAYGHDGGTAESLAMFAQQARLSNKKLAELSQDQKLFIGSKLVNAPLKELNDLAKLAETDDSILGVNQNADTKAPTQIIAEAAPEGAPTGSSETPAVTSVGPDGQPRTDAGVGANPVVDSGMAAPIPSPVTDTTAGVVGPVVGSGGTVESGGTGGTPIQAEPANQIPQVPVEPTGAGPAADTSISGPDNRLTAGSGTLTDTSAGVQPDTGRGSNDSTADAASTGNQQQPVGRDGLDPQAFDRRPAGMPKVDTKGLTTDVKPDDTTNAAQRIYDILNQNKQTADDLGVDTIPVNEDVVRPVPKVQVKRAKPSKTSKTTSKRQSKPIAEASEYDAVTLLNGIDNRFVSAADKQKLTVSLYKEALGEPLNKAEQARLDKVRDEYNIPRIAEFGEPDLSNGTVLDKLINMLPPDYWLRFMRDRFSSAGDVLYVMRQGLVSDDRRLQQRYDYLRTLADRLQNARIKYAIRDSPVSVKEQLLASKGVRIDSDDVTLMQYAETHGLPDVELPPNLATTLMEYQQQGKTVDPVMMTRALMDPEGTHAKVLQRQLCPSK